MKKKYVRANAELVNIGAEKTIFSASLNDQGMYWCEEYCYWHEYIVICMDDGCSAIWITEGCNGDPAVLSMFGDWVEGGEC